VADEVDGLVLGAGPLHGQSPVAGPPGAGHLPQRHRPGFGTVAGLLPALPAALPPPLAGHRSLLQKWKNRPMSFLRLHADMFDAWFGRKPFMVRHHLSDNALFSLRRLAALAAVLPAESVEYNAGDVP